MQHNNHPYLGFGLGLRASHYPYIYEHEPKVDWFEIISENFLDTDGRPKRNLARIKEMYPIVMHGVSMSIGTIDPLNSEYLRKLKSLIKWVKPAWISDHLCWTGVAHKNTHDLLPMPYTEEALKHIVQRIKQVQDFLEYPIALENPSTYLEFKSSCMTEAEFIASMAKESGCNLLLDINNIYVTCYNHRIDPKLYIDTLPLEKVIQIHLSGHTNKGTHIIDTHDDYVVDEVWELYKYVTHKMGRITNTMVEWDDNIPEMPVLIAELEKARIASANPGGYKLPDITTEIKTTNKGEIRPLQVEQTLMQDAVILGKDFASIPEEWINQKEKFSAQEQLNVYINAYRYRLYDTTAEDYPVLEHYLGKEKFRKLIWEFVNTEYSECFNIARYPLKLANFIKMTMPEDIMAYELCQLETAITQLEDAEETTPLNPEYLQGLTPEALMESVLYPRKALQLFEFIYPVNSYYHDVMEAKQPGISQPEASYVAVFRHEDTVWRMALEEGEYRLLSDLFIGTKIGDALEGLDDSIAVNLSNWFSRWIRNGLLAVPQYN